jgi:threonine synthase
MPVSDTTKLVCRSCSSGYAHGPLYRGCPRCGGTLFVSVPRELVTESYRKLCQLPAVAVAELAIPGLKSATGLGEGQTPMPTLEKLGPQLGLGTLWIKNETVNPTASYKDRLNAVAVASAVELGIERLTTSSTGNQAVSMAAYAAAAGLAADVFLPLEAPARAAAEVERTGGRAWVTRWELRAPAIRELVEHHGYGYVGRNCPRPLANPYGLEGYKTIAYEIVRDLGDRVPDEVFMPSCGGDGVFGVWRGFRELAVAGIIGSLPRMVGCQVEAAPAVTKAWRAGLAEVLPVAPGNSIALSLVDERGGDHALWALYESGGRAVAVTERDLVEAMSRLGRLGILAEPAGAAGMAGLARCVAAGSVTPSSRVVVVVTGGGGRWPASIADVIPGRRTDEPVRSVLSAGVA